MMKSIVAPLTLLFVLAVSGCDDRDAAAQEEKTKPTFMFWCFRKEIVSAEFHVPDMSTPAAASYIANHLRALPGYVDCTSNLDERTLTVSYQGSTIRTMNIEEAIALSGFAVNLRPANPNAKVPEGIL